MLYISFVLSVGVPLHLPVVFAFDAELFEVVTGTGNVRFLSLLQVILRCVRIVHQQIVYPDVVGRLGRVCYPI